MKEQIFQGQTIVGGQSPGKTVIQDNYIHVTIDI